MAMMLMRVVRMMLLRMIVPAVHRIMRVIVAMIVTAASRVVMFLMRMRTMLSLIMSMVMMSVIVNIAGARVMPMLAGDWNRFFFHRIMIMVTAVGGTAPIVCLCRK